MPLPLSRVFQSLSAVPRGDNVVFVMGERLCEHVGIIDLTPFTKHEVTGPGAESWLDGLVANKVPTKTGRIALCHALTRRGGIRSEFTITKIADNHFYVVSAGAAERYDSDYLQQMLPTDGSVALRNITTSRGCFVVAGSNGRLREPRSAGRLRADQRPAQAGRDGVRI